MIRIVNKLKSNSIMKTILFNLLLFSFVFVYQSNAQQLEWAVAAQGIDSEQATAVHSNDKFIYHAGRLDGAALTTFGPGESRETDVNAANYIARHTQSGALSWVKTITSPFGSILHINGIDTDAAGNVYIVGEVGLSDFTFGPGEPNETTISSGLSGSPRDVFVAKYNINGIFQWVRQAGNVSHTSGNDIAVDANGNSYIVGDFNTSITFGADGNTTPVDLVASGWEDDIDAFIAKYDTNGDLVWAEYAGGDYGYDYAESIDLDHKNNLYVGGRFSEEIIFGFDVPATSILITAFGGSDGFLARYSPNGVPIWAVPIGGNDIDFVRDVETRQGKTLVVGRFLQTATFGSTDGATQQLIDQAAHDYFVARYNRQGELLWARGIFMDGTLNGISVGYGIDQQSCVVGNFSGMATFGDGQLNETTLNSPGDADSFIACYSGNGAFQSVEPDPVPVKATSMPNNGDVVVAGDFSGNVVFGPYDPNDTFLFGQGSWDIFLAKYVIGGPVLDFTSKASSIQESNEAFTTTAGVPDAVVLEGNYPNPFNPQTTIRFGLPEAAQVSLTVYDMTGRAVANLVNGSMAAGTHEVNFDAANLPSGMYLYRLNTPAGEFTRTMSFLK